MKASSKVITKGEDIVHLDLEPKPKCASPLMDRSRQGSLSNVYRQLHESSKNPKIWGALSSSSALRRPPFNQTVSRLQTFLNRNYSNSMKEQYSAISSPKKSNAPSQTDLTGCEAASNSCDGSIQVGK